MMLSKLGKYYTEPCQWFIAGGDGNRTEIKKMSGDKNGSGVLNTEKNNHKEEKKVKGSSNIREFQV